ncbi:MAG: hypothetical protein R2991_04280 [Thermoanaerobaculia bacterium]
MPTVVNCAGWKWVKPRAGDGARASREVGERQDGRGQTAFDQLQRLARQQDVGVVGDEGAGGAQVEDPARLAGELGEVLQVRHDVVARLASIAATRSKSMVSATSRRARAAPRRCRGRSRWHSARVVCRRQEVL